MSDNRTESPLDEAASATASSADVLPGEAADARDLAIRLRAQAAVVRAEQAHRRAEEALRGVDASKRRKTNMELES